jgi:hypothetical protein
VATATAATGGERSTDICATIDGYTDDFCSRCGDGFYKENEVCRACGGDENGEFLTLVIVAVIMFGILTAGIATLNNHDLSIFVDVIITLQQLSLVSKVAGTYVSNPTLVRIIELFSLANFDVQFFKPGCSVGKVDFSLFFYITLALVIAVGFLFIAATTLRIVICPRESDGIYARQQKKRQRRLERRQVVADTGGDDATPHSDESSCGDSDDDDDDDDDDEDSRNSDGNYGGFADARAAPSVLPGLQP